MAAPFQYNPASPMDSVMNMASGLSNLFSDQAKRQEVARRTQAMYGGLGQAPTTFNFQDAGQPALQAGGVSAPALPGSAAPATTAMQGIELPPEVGPVMDPEQMSRYRAAVQANWRQYPLTTETWLRQQGLQPNDVLQGFGPLGPETQAKLMQMGNVAVPQYSAGTETPDFKREQQTFKNVYEGGQGLAQPGMPATSVMPAEVQETTFTPAAQNVGVPAATAMLKLNSQEELTRMKEQTRRAANSIKITPQYKTWQSNVQQARALQQKTNDNFQLGLITPQQQAQSIAQQQFVVDQNAALLEIWGAAQTQGENAARRMAAGLAPQLGGAPAEVVETAIQDGLRSGVLQGGMQPNIDPLLNLGSTSTSQTVGQTTKGGGKVVQPKTSPNGEPADLSRFDAGKQQFYRNLAAKTSWGQVIQGGAFQADLAKVRAASKALPAGK